MGVDALDVLTFLTVISFIMTRSSKGAISQRVTATSQVSRQWTYGSRPSATDLSSKESSLQKFYMRNSPSSTTSPRLDSQRLHPLILETVLPGVVPVIPQPN